MRDFIKKYGLLFVIIFLIILSISLFFYKDKENNNLTFAVLDVGQGDSIFIESPNGTQVLIDGGKDSRVIKELFKVMPFYDKSIDILIMTNPDMDHIGGFNYVLDQYEVDAFFEPGTYNDSSVYKNLQNKIEEKNIKHYFAKKGLKIDIGSGGYIEILFPDRDVSTWENNDGSLVAQLVYGNNKIMLMGDATYFTENIILENYKDEFLKSNFIKIGHHGSRTSSNLEFLKRVNPEYALISSGKDNNYGHPEKEILDKLENLDIKILRTDMLGTIIFECDKIETCKIKK